MKPKNDLREESQKVDPDSIIVRGRMSESERRILLNPLIRENFSESNAKGESITLIRPKSIKVKWSKKTTNELLDERQKHAELSRQLSLLDGDIEDLDPCPYSFKLFWVDQNDGKHEHEMDDWETIGAYARFEGEYGEEKALEIIKLKYEQERIKKTRFSLQHA
ncbi:MAG: hypothetical protein P8H62_02510 [Henriciella sp.]|nr:hypothetical protein [Henriciella sp.]